MLALCIRAASFTEVGNGLFFRSVSFSVLSSPPKCIADLKPQNVLCNRIRNGVVCKVCDFGISSIGSASSSARTQTAGMGTVVFLAPEAAEGRHGVGRCSYKSDSPGLVRTTLAVLTRFCTRYGGSVDIYSFGILLFILYTGDRDPFAGVGGGQFGLQRHISTGGRPVFPGLDQAAGAGAGTDAATSAEGVRQVAALAAWCWAQQPDERPTFIEIDAAMDGWVLEE